MSGARLLDVVLDAPGVGYIGFLAILPKGSVKTRAFGLTSVERWASGKRCCLAVISRCMCAVPSPGSTTPSCSKELSKSEFR